MIILNNMDRSFHWCCSRISSAWFEKSNDRWESPTAGGQEGSEQLGSVPLLSGCVQYCTVSDWNLWTPVCAVLQPTVLSLCKTKYWTLAHIITQLQVPASSCHQQQQTWYGLEMSVFIVQSADSEHLHTDASAWRNRQVERAPTVMTGQR